jgi:hypothetical protein
LPRAELWIRIVRRIELIPQEMTRNYCSTYSSTAGKNTEYRF